MDGRKFDKLAKRLSRRGFLAAAGAAGALSLRGAKAAQVGPATCGQSGDVCTMMLGCCSGFTCVTSAINVNYGVCVSGGNGGRVSTGTGLISPFSDGIEEEIAAMQADPAFTGTGTTTDVKTPEERRAEIKARRDARQSKRSSRRTTQKSKKETRRTTRRTERDTQEEADRIAAGPLIEGEIFNPGKGEGDSDALETLKVTNRDIGTVTLVRIESIDDPRSGTEFVDSRLPVLPVGGSFNFYSKVIDQDQLGANEIGWIPSPICVPGASPTAGFRLYVSFSSNSPNREYEFFCDTPLTPAPLAETALPLANTGERRKKRKQKQRAKRRQKARNGNDKKGKAKGRGKGKR